MIGGASCTSQSIRGAVGSCSSCARSFPFEVSHKYVIFDRDQKFGFEMIAAVSASRIIPKRTSFRSPWQNGIAERWVGSCRRDLLDHICAE
jgi:hypothetical protein